MLIRITAAQECDATEAQSRHLCWYTQTKTKNYKLAIFASMTHLR